MYTIKSILATAAYALLVLLIQKFYNRPIISRNHRAATATDQVRVHPLHYKICLALHRISFVEIVGKNVKCHIFQIN